MPTITVTDVSVRSRKVKLPSACPGCNRRLREDGALKVRGFVDESRSGWLRRAGDVDAIAGLVLGDGLPDGGETFIDNVSVLCGLCGHPLAEGAFTVRPGRW